MEAFDEQLFIFKLDDSFDYQQNIYSTYPSKTIDFTDIPGKNLYCDPIAEKEIKQRLVDCDWHLGITMIGSGNFHYFTYFLLSHIREPFTLYLFDHHTDMKDHVGPLSCGSWVLWALRNLSYLTHLIILGSPAHSINDIPKEWRHKVTLIPDASLDTLKISEFILKGNAYISIDKDVLSKNYARTHWSQGKLSLPVLLSIIQQLIKTTTLIGMDICGEWSSSPTEVYLPKNQLFVRKNEHTNRLILGSVLETNRLIHKNESQHHS